VLNLAPEILKVLTRDQDDGGGIERVLFDRYRYILSSIRSHDNYLLLRVPAFGGIIAPNSNKAQSILVAFHD
jgi:hypothetical protein